MNLRIKISALGLSIFALLHAKSAVSWADAGLPAGLWLMLGFQAMGCALAAYGLLFKRSWARGLAVAIALAAFTQISVMLALVVGGGYQLDSGQELVWGTAQWIGCAAMALALSGSAMRRRFEERPDSPWDFDKRLTRIARSSAIAAIASVPMLLSMAAYAVYAEGGHTPALVGAAGMMLAVFLLVQNRSIGLLLLFGSAIVAATGTLLVLTSLDTNPAYASQDIYLSRTIAAAVALLPGLVLGALSFVAFAPRLLRTLRS